MGDFYGLRTDTISNNIVSIEYLLDAGPRIVRLYYKGTNENLLAEVPERYHETVFGKYYFRGGHRLWHAPEDILRTYIPDNDPITITKDSENVILTQPVELATGIHKTIQVNLSPNAAKVTVHHTLKNVGLWPVKLSAWALTQFPLGGVAIFPQNTSTLDTAGLLPNRNLSLWSYASVNDPRLSMADDFITIKALPSLPPLKIGYANGAGWIAYIRNSLLFIKRFPPLSNQSYPDLGCNVESYIGDSFIELESLSPLTLVDPGQSLHHIETWEILHIANPSDNLDDVRQLVNEHSSLSA